MQIIEKAVFLYILILFTLELFNDCGYNIYADKIPILKS